MLDDAELALDPAIPIIEKSDAVERLVLVKALVLPSFASISRVNDGGLRTDRPDLIGILAAAHRENVFDHALGPIDFFPGLAAIGRAQDQPALAANHTIVGVGGTRREERVVRFAFL